MEIDALLGTSLEIIPSIVNFPIDYNEPLYYDMPDIESTFNLLI